MTVHVSVRTRDKRHRLVALLGQTAPDLTDGRGGWNTIDRPRRPGAIEWVGTKPMSATLTLMLDGWAKNRSVLGDIHVIDRMALRNPTHEQSPVAVTNAWPIPPNIWWQIQTVTWLTDGMLRNARNEIVRTEVTLELIEYRLAEVVLAKNSPAKRSADKSGKTTKGRTVTVKKGDTLSAIAARYLGSASKWPQIAKENNLRSPKNLRVGQKLRLP